MDKMEEKSSVNGVDVSLIDMFLNMTPEERILTNNNAVTAIEEWL